MPSSLAVQNEDLPLLLPPETMTKTETQHNFFKQQRAMNYHNYLKLKKQEKIALKKHLAVVLIQKVFRGWLVRANMKLIRKAAIKMQALWRRAIARDRYKILDQARQEKRILDLQNKMATKIQAAWRGYASRKNNFNFKLYKDIQNKNKKAKEAAESASALENVIAGSSISNNGSDTSVDDKLNRANSNMIRSLENLLNADLVELSRKLSPTRIAQLYAFAKANVEAKAEEARKDSLGSRKGSRGQTGPQNPNQINLEQLAEYLKSGSFDADDPLALLALLGNQNNEDVKDEPEIRTESADMFPELPDSEDYYHTDPEKVQMLKDAIRFLREDFQKAELNKLAKIHYLMRTTAIPGVYSDIYTNELTEMETKFKDLKFLDKKVDAQNLLKKKMAKEAKAQANVQLLAQKERARISDHNANEFAKKQKKSLKTSCLSQSKGQLAFQNKRPRNTMTSASAEYSTTNENLGQNVCSNPSWSCCCVMCRKNSSCFDFAMPPSNDGNNIC